MSVKFNNNFIIGLTGGIATGKSTVSAYLKDKGYQVIDSDLIVHKLWEQNEQMIIKVVKTFDLENDKDIINQIKKIVFNNDEKLKLLNEIVHPFVFDQIDQEIKFSKHEMIFIDMPLLFEVGYQNNCDETWLVYTPQSIQLKRLMKRDHMQMIEAVKRIGVQMDIEQKKMIADHILDNRKSKHHLYSQIDQLLKGYKHEK